MKLFSLSCSANCVLPSNPTASKATTFAITDTKLSILVAALSTDYNAKVLQQLESGLKDTINCNKYLGSK